MSASFECSSSKDLGLEMASGKGRAQGDGPRRPGVELFSKSQAGFCARAIRGADVSGSSLLAPSIALSETALDWPSVYRSYPANTRGLGEGLGGSGVIVSDDAD